MSQKITRRRALARLVLAAAAPIAASTALRCGSAVAEEKPVLQGYGRCASCACPGFTGSYNVCQNCGHNYQTHW
jgi:hypothetical protein